MGHHFYGDINSDDGKNKLAPSLPPSQLNTLLTCQENMSGQEIDCSFRPPLTGFVPQMQLTTLQDKIQIE